MILRFGFGPDRMATFNRSSRPGSGSLDAVAKGREVRVRDVHGSDATALRLLEMGLTPGAAIRVLGRAPFGDPLELEVRGYRLSLRGAEAARVSVGEP
jgi:ferrous iron transport protein A